MFKMLPIIFILIITSTAFCLEEDLSSCIEDLDRLGKAVNDALKVAEEAEFASEELKSKEDELQNCIENPDVTSPTWDNGKSLRSDCEALKKNHKEKLKKMESAIKKIADKIKAVEWSCGVQFSNGSAGKSKEADNVNCEILKNLKEKIPINELLDLCKKSMSEAECKKCLEIE